MDFEPTPRERAAYDRNVAHANLALGDMVALTRAAIAAGHTGEDLFNAVLDLVVAASNPRRWPKGSMGRDAALATMLVEAVRALAVVPRAGVEPASSRV